MTHYEIITDSTCDLPKNLIDSLNIKVITMEYIINGKECANDNTMDISVFYKLLREKKQVTTSKISTGHFIREFEKFVRNGRDVIYISLSSALSGTYFSAMVAADELMQKYPGRKVLVVDSLSGSLGEGMLVYYATKKRDRGTPINELKEWLEQAKKSLLSWFTVDNLFHLKRGGRISSASATIGAMLGVKPIVCTNKEGKLELSEKVRGKKASLMALVNKVENMIDFSKGKEVFISHADALDDAMFVAKLIKERLNIKNILINYIGPTMGTHSGPGAVALFFMGK